MTQRRRSKKTEVEPRRFGRRSFLLGAGAAACVGAGLWLRRKELSEQDKTGKQQQLKEEQADLVIYAGFMTILDEQVCDAFKYKMINVHPALIPSFCGKGYYGLHVHEEALKKGVKVTGATVHFVTAECDAGPIILQKAVEVRNGDTPEVLQKRVMEQAEWKILPRAARLFCEGKITVKDGITVIDN